MDTCSWLKSKKFRVYIFGYKGNNTSKFLDFTWFCLLCWLYKSRLLENSKRIFVFNDCPLRSFRKSIIIRELTGQNIPIKRFFCHRQETTGDYWHLKSMNCVAKRLCTPRTHSHDQMSQDSFSNHIVSPSLHRPLVLH